MDLTKYRTAAGISQQELAQRSGLSLGLIQDIESGGVRARNIREYDAMRIARVLRVDVSELLGAVNLDDGRLVYLDEFEWFNPDEGGTK